MASVILASYLSMVTLFYMMAKDLREAIVKSYVVFFALILFTTEVLSVFTQISFRGFAVSWLLILLFTTVYLVGMRKRLVSFSGTSKTYRLSIGPPFTHLEKICLFVVVLTVVITGITAYISPPNNFDSMTYHMPRVASWIQNGTVDYFVTSINRQNYQMPLAEFAILTLQILSESDQYANLVQWSSFIVCLVLVSLIARDLKMSRNEQWLTAALAATLPMAILQGSTTQNDLVVSVFFMGFAWFLLKLRESISPVNLVFCGLTFGLAILTKGTAYVFCLGLGVVLGGNLFIAYIRKRQTRTIVSGMLVVLAIGLLLNSGYFLRNIDLYGKPIPTFEGLYLNEQISMKALVSNLVRNAVMHFGTPLEDVNRSVVGVAEAILGNELNNPLTTFKHTTFMAPFSLSEDLAGNPLHMAIILLALLALACNREKLKVILPYTLALISSVLLYCGLLKWQPWASRLQTPLFLTAMPIVVVGMSAFIAKQKKLVALIILMLAIYSVPFQILSHSRPLLALEPFRHSSILDSEDRLSWYFASQPGIAKDYSQTFARVQQKGAKDIGLHLSSDDYEYPFWVMARRHASKGMPVLRHVGVSDASQVKAVQGKPLPEYVLSTKVCSPVEIDGSTYEVFFESKSVCALHRMDVKRE